MTTRSIRTNIDLNDARIDACCEYAADKMDKQAKAEGWLDQVMEPEGSERYGLYTPKAQEVFDKYYDEAEQKILDESRTVQFSRPINIEWQEYSLVIPKEINILDGRAVQEYAMANLDKLEKIGERVSERIDEAHHKVWGMNLGFHPTIHFSVE